MENLLVQENTQENDWRYIWAKYLTKSPVFQTETEKNQAQQIICEILNAVEQGDSCMPISTEHVKGLRSLVAFSEKKYLAPFIFDGQAVYLYRYYALEQRLAQQVQRLMHQAPEVVATNDYMELLEDIHQQNALNMVGQQAFNMITGGPGTGKTYTLARIIAALNHALPHIKIAMAAPTGKAAQRMQEALQKAFSDSFLQQKNLITPELKMLTPMTLHRLLGMGHHGIAKFNLKRPLPYDVIVVDEASMLDLNLAMLLFEAVPTHARLILLGDAQQLSSVDVGSVLADLQSIESLKKNRVHLHTSRRFSDDALIGKMAQFIQTPHTKQESILKDFEKAVVSPSTLKPVVLNEIEQDFIQLEYLADGALNSVENEHYLNALWYGYANYATALIEYLKAEEHTEELRQNILNQFDHYRILTAMRYGRFGVVQINQYMEKKLLNQLLPYTNKVGDWYVGRPVMMTENDYQIGLSNGDIGICFFHRTQSQQYEVYFPSLDKWVSATRLPKHIQTAFALTIHKSQGSEFTHTAVVLEPDAEKLLSQELIYTAITRAKKVVSLLVSEKSFLVSLFRKTTRMSGLVRKIEI